MTKRSETLIAGQSVVFASEGIIPLEAFTTFGMSAKPSTDNPIGMFGTGLKYAIAVLVRSGAEVVVVRGGEQHVFYTEKVHFRGEEFEQIMMRSRKGLLAKWKATKLPFTTELGKFWDLWQAYRELESNTRDENGRTNLWTEATPYDQFDEGTRIIVTHPGFERVHFNRDNIFLPESSMSKVTEMRAAGQRIQIIPRASEYIFYRGLRVFKLPKESYYTYNIIQQVELTEDRTLKYNFLAEEYVTLAVMESTSKELILALLGLGEQARWFEQSLSYDDTYLNVKVSEEFREVLKSKVRGNETIPPRAMTYYKTSVAPPQPTKRWIDGITLANYLETNPLLLTTDPGAYVKLMSAVIKFLRGGDVEFFVLNEEEMQPGATEEEGALF